MNPRPPAPGVRRQRLEQHDPSSRRARRASPANRSRARTHTQQRRDGIRPWNALSLFWRVFVMNALVLGLAFAGLVARRCRSRCRSPRARPSCSARASWRSLTVSLLLAAAGVSPARRARRDDATTRPALPRRTRQVDGDPDVAALAHAFNEMLERMEFERRDSARGALMLQEAERQRIARELHDEVGQTLTGVMLQVEGLAATLPDELRDQLDELRETARHGTEEVRRIARRLRPEALEDLGLQSALSALATALRRAAPGRRPTAARARPRADRRTGARRLPHRPGSPDQRRPPR